MTGSVALKHRSEDDDTPRHRGLKRKEGCHAHDDVLWAQCRSSHLKLNVGLSLSHSSRPAFRLVTLLWTGALQPILHLVRWQEFHNGRKNNRQLCTSELAKVSSPRGSFS